MSMTVCNANSLNCDDVLSIIIQTLLDLKIATGATTNQIFQRAQIICPTVTLDIIDIQNALAHGARIGALFRRRAQIGDEATYLVQAYMNRFNNAGTSLYYRPPCQANSFWKP